MWPEVPLSPIVADVVRGITFSQGDAIREPREGHVPVLRAGNIGATLAVDRDLVWIPKSFVSAQQVLRPHDIVMCTSSGSPAVVGKTAMLDTEFEGTWGAFNAVIRVREHALPRFVFFFLQSSLFRNWRNRHATGANIQNIRISELARLRIPLPPTSEQRRIVDLLDEADSLRSLRRDADAKAARFLPVLFLKMFGDPATNPKGWPLLPIRNLVHQIQRRDPTLEPESEFTYVDISGVDGKRGEIVESRRLSGSDAPSRARQVIRANDVLVSTVRPYLRATALVSDDLDNQIASTGFCVLRSNAEFGHGYLYALTRLQWFTEQLNARARGASYPAVTDSDVMELRIPGPTAIDALREFDRRVKEVGHINLQRARLSRSLETLFSLLLNRAFTGTLTKNWRNAHMKDLLAEMQQQAKLLNIPPPSTKRLVAEA